MARSRSAKLRKAHKIHFNTNFNTTVASKARFSSSCNDIHLNCRLQCMRCKAETVTGERCSRTTCLSLPFCWQHLKYFTHLKILPTTLFKNNTPVAGLGLFADDASANPNPVFKPGDIITSYIGQRRSQEETDKDYGDCVAPYALKTSSNVVIDAACLRSVAAFANDIRNDNTCSGKCLINAQLYSNGNFYPVMKATKDIYHGDEIFVNYGEGYWNGVEITHKTRR